MLYVIKLLLQQDEISLHGEQKNDSIPINLHLVLFITESINHTCFRTRKTAKNETILLTFSNGGFCCHEKRQNKDLVLRKSPKRLWNLREWDAF